MKIIITGSRGIAKSLYDLLSKNHEVTLLNKIDHDIQRVAEWHTNYQNVDVLINSAYSDFAQVRVLECFYNMWREDSSKKIINIGSMVIDYPRADKNINDQYWSYRVHKQALELAFSKMVKNSECEIKLINFGPVDTDMTKHLNIEKFTLNESAQYISNIMNDSNIKRIDLWK